MGWVKIIFNEKFYKKYPISWVFGYGYVLGRYIKAHSQNSWFFSIKLWLDPFNQKTFFSNIYRFIYQNV